MYQLIDREKRKSTQHQEERTVKHARSFTSGFSALTVTPETSDTQSTPIVIDSTMTEFQPAETWCRVKELLLTSKEYTSRDKKEIMAQWATFEGLTVLREIASTQEGTKKEALVNMYNQGAKQLTLYYLVGTHGWETAVNTVKSSEATALGIPEPVFKPAANIIYVKSNAYAPRSTQPSSSYSKRGKGRRAYGKN